MSGEISVVVQPVDVTAQTTTVAVTTTNQGIQGIQGPQGPAGAATVVAGDSPITVTGSPANPHVGIDQTLINITPSQVSGTAVITTDSRLSDSRTPTAHASTHGAAGSDPITITEAQVTGLVSDLASKVSSVTAGDGTITVGGTAAAPTIKVGTIAESQVSGLTSDLASKVSSVTAGDSSITIAGTAAAPTVAVNQANLTIAESQVTNLTTDLAGKVPTTAVGVSVAPLDTTGTYNGKVNPSYLPSTTIANTYVVNSQAAMLALAAEVGDIAVRTDVNLTFILQATPASTLANWTQILTPTTTVTSFNGNTGAVTGVGTLSAGDTTITVGGTATAPTVKVAPANLTGIPAAGVTGTAVTQADTGTVTNAMLAGSISPSKVTGTAITAADTGTVTGTMIANGTITDTDISASAAIAASKISGTAITAADTGTVTSTMIANGTIVDADVSSTAAIAKTKISGTAITAADTGTVTNAMLAGSIAPSKITGTAITAADTGTVTGTMIANGTITDSDISSSAAIAPSKISGTAVTQADTGTVSTNMIANNAVTLAKTSGPGASGGVGGVFLATNPTLTPSSGKVSWVITHGFGRNPVTVLLLQTTGALQQNHTITQGDGTQAGNPNPTTKVTVSWRTAATVTAGTYTAIVLG